MNVYEIRMKIYFLKDIAINIVQKKVTAFIDSSFTENEFLMQLHKKNAYKYYTFDLPYKIESDKLYKKDKIYTLTIRTVDKTLAEHFYNVCVNSYTDEIKGITAQIRIIPKKHIDTIYTLTPIVIKNEDGYWRKIMTLSDFEKRLKDNLFKKYKAFTGEDFDEDFEFYISIEFLNKIPISIEYKSIKLIGDKIRLRIAENATSQNLAYFSLASGLGEMNARGMGFVNYRWL